jgi:sugar O-acyltransferase (sialic acid O-acetyltransferase NeuD family)
MDALLSARGVNIDAVFADHNPALAGTKILGRVVRVYSAQSFAPDEWVHVAIGDNAVRERLAAVADQRKLLSVLHPQACVSRFASLGGGVFVAARAVVAPLAQVEQGTIVNHGAIVDHDCLVGAFTHLAPGSVLGGGVRVGRRVLVGAGAVIKPGVLVGDDATIGAGSVVLDDIASGSTVVGVPAKLMRKDRA